MRARVAQSRCLSRRVRETVAVVECDRRFASEDFPLRFKNPAKDKADFPIWKREVL